jgi:hypothetical protein
MNAQIPRSKFFSSGPGTLLQLVLTLIIASITIVNVVIAARLEPVAASLNDWVTHVKAYEQENQEEHDKLVPVSTFNLLDERVSHISNRVDQIYGIVVQLKK